MSFTKDLDPKDLARHYVHLLLQSESTTGLFLIETLELNQQDLMKNELTELIP